jgi:hypothetical protein
MYELNDHIPNSPLIASSALRSKSATDHSLA